MSSNDFVKQIKLTYICRRKYNKFLRGHRVPSFYINNLENLKSIVSKISEENLKDSTFFIVDIIVSADKGPTKITILLDADNGVNIDDCANLSRSVGHYLEENELIDSKYTLEVTSPGVDHPLNSVRMYKKNIGRKLKVTTSEGNEIKALLKEVSDDKVLLDKEVKKGKKIDHEPIELTFDQIKKAIVQVSFK